MAVSRAGHPRGSLSVQRSVIAPGAGLALAQVTGHRDEPAHVHAVAHLGLFLGGHYEERHGRAPGPRAPLSVSFHAPGERHGGRYGDAPARFLLVEMSPAWALSQGLSLERWEPVAVERTRALPRLLSRMGRELMLSDSVSPLALHALLLEAMVEVSRAQRPRRGAPPVWWVRARAQVEACYREPLSVSAVAAAVGVSPSELAGGFRRWCGVGMGAYVRRLRVEFAARALVEGDASLTDIALDAGFCDHSHLTRAFKALMGRTPSAYRAERRLA
ncbi:AraC family transcriptional regulator [Corallococcus sp. M34]|uniref:helix-turn-helix transcriptional regulator n=1 Tax=Citreicoccus inhibens TaxID=2849499 RepID=UPI0013150FCF|nr:AraC family transcriptional regulator [Citreicoccus inhibens]MBU8900282.1 AraC family transcriptional regulator [Citreicoccus inhibens]